MNVCLLDPPRDGPVEVDAPFVASEFVVKWATEPWERREAHALRRATFCHEQGIFVGDDADATDACSQLIVAVSVVAGEHDQVVGTVRIHRDSDEAQTTVWWGSRLAVHPSFRRIGRLGAGLIRLAVGSAHAQGCTRFVAHVQSQNAPMFEKLHWHTLAELNLHGRPHHHMQADLAHYPPVADGDAGFVLAPSIRA
jgi:putative N-acetyltransferase (TIGR04045 family)